MPPAETDVARHTKHVFSSPTSRPRTGYSSSECMSFEYGSHSSYASNSGTGSQLACGDESALVPYVHGVSPARRSLDVAKHCSSDLRHTAKRLTFNGVDPEESKVEATSNALVSKMVVELVGAEEEEEYRSFGDDDAEYVLHECSSDDALEVISLNDSEDNDTDKHKHQITTLKVKDESISGDDEAHQTFKPARKPCPTRGSVAHQAEKHQRKVESAFSDFRCDCPFKAPGDLNCLEQYFTRPQLRKFHYLVFGASGVDDSGVPLRNSLKQIKEAIHLLVWELRVPLPKQNSRGHLFCLPQYKLDGKLVCKEAFRTVTGGSPYAHRTALQLTLNGVHPNEQLAHTTAAKITRQMINRQTSKTNWAISWWKRHLMYQDFLPNECKIQYRGRTWVEVHKSLYEPEAQLVNMVLKKTQWFRALRSALDQLKNELYVLDDPRLQALQSKNPQKDVKLTLTRSARHSKFPECKDCQKLRTDYQKVASKLSSSKEEVQKKYDALLAHTKEWQLDRETACDLRHRCSACEYEAIYEVDDKCGSYWQRLPVGETGRDTKQNAKAVYRFSVQANVICGQNGIQRFTIVPKNVKVGSNFGLTNLMMTLLQAKQSGRLKPHVTHLYRHTDGGPDNVSVVTHFVHWLLVYLGIFQKITWFRFKAGHSHTETADRLFALLKRHFESDSRHRVAGMNSFVELTNKVEAEFANTCEGSTFAWDFANWDFKTYASELNVISSKLKGITAKKVFRYSYSEDVWQHGCVLMQYKDNIGFKGTSKEAEWSPIMTVEEEVPTMDGEGVEMSKRNVSTVNGVRFVVRPPDLRCHVRREPWDQSDKYTPAASIKFMLKRREKDMNADDLRSWSLLKKVHEMATNSSTFPKLPHTVSDSQLQSVTFHGAPQDFKDTMQQLMRFPRPMLKGSVFDEKPPANWDAAREIMHAMSSEEKQNNEDRPRHARESNLRDPKRVNDIQHEDYSSPQRRRDLQEIAKEDYARQPVNRVEKVIVGDLYLLELEQPEHGVRLGLGKVDSREPRTSETDEEKWKVLWFTSKANQAWSKKNPTFQQWKVNNKRQVDVFSIEYFRLHVEKKDMTKTGWKRREEFPSFTNLFACKVLGYAQAEGLMEDKGKQPSDSGEDEDEEESEDEDSSVGDVIEGAQGHETDKSLPSSDDDEGRSELDSLSEDASVSSPLNGKNRGKSKGKAGTSTSRKRKSKKKQRSTHGSSSADDSDSSSEKVPRRPAAAMRSKGKAGTSTSRRGQSKKKKRSTQSSSSSDKSDSSSEVAPRPTAATRSKGKATASTSRTGKSKKKQRALSSSSSDDEEDPADSSSSEEVAQRAKKIKGKNKRKGK